jgi:putative aldouronate transport system substrate-binding protein
MYNAFNGHTVKAYVERGQTFEKPRDEELVKIVRSEKTLDDFDHFVKQWYGMGGQEATDQVKLWYQEKKKEQAALKP